MRVKFSFVIFCWFGFKGSTCADGDSLIKGDSFSFSRFRGPVSGETEEIIVPNTNPHHVGSHTVDYMAKADYSFAHGVYDKDSGTSNTHSESRNGDAVHGEYRVMQPDGLIRIVKYFADPDTGFKATVEYVKI